MTATYRLQLTPDFGFADVEALVPYFRRLGVSHLYLSPITESRPGSSHGYDVTDHNAVRDELGGRAGFDRLCRAAHDAGLGLVLDFVPNHAGVGPTNDAWQDVLAYGKHSAYAHHFDVDWHPMKPELQGKILLPFLGSTYGDALDGGDIALTYDDGHFFATYYEHRFACAPETYGTFLGALLPAYERTDAFFDLRELRDTFDELSPGERDRAEGLCRRLAALDVTFDDEELREALPLPSLHDVFDRQHWRLAFWKTAGREINYRRFFTINDLVGLRMEDETLFWDSHRLLGDLLAQDGVDGVRIDHVDGLFAPQPYLDRLHDLGAARIWVEKILAPGETLPASWPVEGTTGYDFLNDVLGVLLRRDRKGDLQQLYRRFVSDACSYDEDVYASKRLIIEQTLTSELVRLGYELDRLSEQDYHTRDVTLTALREALAEIVAAFDRYRTYLPREDDAQTHDVVQRAIHRAQQRTHATEPTVFRFIADTILGDLRDDLEDDRRAWVGRFQQYTAPVAAKGVEDTAFYRYVPLAALNEVGGEPDAFGTEDHAFHARNRYRARETPRALVTTATHDHKRGAGTRMRSIALAEVPDRWSDVVRALNDLAAPYRSAHGPSDRDVYLFYQTLVALWCDASGGPRCDADREDLADRLAHYAQKAAREAKLDTSWVAPDADYEDALDAFVRGVTTDPDTAGVIDDLASDLARAGFANRVSQIVLKATVPGVPDVYRGTERADLSLVDPDNRRPVDWNRRRNGLDALQPLLDAPSADDVRALLDAQTPDAYLYVTARLLQWRRAHPDLAMASGYRGLTPHGEGATGWLAFARWATPDATPGAMPNDETDASPEQAMISVVHRHPLTRDVHAPAHLPLPDALRGRTWTDVLTATPVDAPDAVDVHSLPLPLAAVLVSD